MGAAFVRKTRRKTISRASADFFFYLRDIHHHDGIPRTAIGEAAVRTIAETLLAADTENGINLDAAEERVVLVVRPEHAVLDRAVLHAGGRTGAARVARLIFAPARSHIFKLNSRGSLRASRPLFLCHSMRPGKPRPIAQVCFCRLVRFHRTWLLQKCDPEVQKSWRGRSEGKYEPAQPSIP